MFKLLQTIVMISLVFLQACQHKESKEPEQTQPSRKINLSKAAEYNVQLGLGYLKQGNRIRAKKKLLAALNQAPKSPESNAAMAYYFEQTSDFVNAKKHYEKAIALAGTVNSVVGAQYNNYGTFLCRRGDYKKAETYFRKAVKDVRYLNTAGAYENAGLCSLAVPDDDKARSYFIQALEQDPSRRASLYELVKLDNKKGHYIEALKLLKAYPELVLNDHIFLALAKDIANKAGDSKLAEEYGINLAKISNGANNEYNDNIG